MATPTLPSAKSTWQINANVLASRSETAPRDNQKILFAVKDILTSFASNPWTVVSSSDATSAGASDYWNDFTNLIWSTGNHSWIVLQKPTTNSQILLSLDRSANDEIIIKWSPDGYFTGGSIAVDPTATDEINITTGAEFNGGLTSYYGAVHIWHSQDGSKTRIVFSSSGNSPRGIWILDEVDPLNDNWSNPEIVCFLSSLITAVDFNISSGWSTYPITPGFKIYNNPTAYNVSLAPIVLDAVPLAYSNYSWHSIQDYSSVPSELISGEKYPLSSLIVYSNDVGARGVHAILQDVYLSTDALASGTTFPNNSSERDWAQFGHFVMPWTGDGTVPLVEFTTTRLNMIDVTGNGYDGTLTNIENEDIEDGVIPGGSFSTSSLSLDLSEYVTMGNVLNFDYIEPFSISAWFKSSAVSSFGNIVSKSASSPFGYELKLDYSSGEIIWQLVNTVTTNHMRVDTSGLTLNDGVWHHVVATWDGNVAGGATGAKIYIDGYSQSLSVVNNTLSSSISNSNPFVLGAKGTGFETFNGNLDEISIWTKDISESEVLEIWNNSSPDDVRLKSFANSYLEAFWRMGEDIFSYTLNTTGTADAYLINSNESSGGSSEIKYYVMIGIDSGNPSQPAYHYWTVQGSPDPTGSLAVGADAPPFGGPLTNIYISTTFTGI